MLAALAALAPAAPSPATERMVLDIGRIDAGGWSSGPVQLRLELAAADRLAARLTASDLDLPGPLGAVRGLVLDCPRAEPTATGIACARAELRLGDGDVDTGSLPVAVELDWGPGGTRLSLRAEGLAPATLWALAARSGELPALEFAGGTLAIEVDIGAGAGAAAQPLRLVVSMQGLGFSDSDGRNAGENLDLRATLEAVRVDGGLRVTAGVAIDAGEMYFDPVFVDAAAHPLSVTAEGVLDSISGRPALSRVRLRHGGIVAVEGSADVAADGALEALELDVPPSPVEPVYRVYLQPFVIGSVLDALALDGEVGAHLSWRAPPQSWRLGIDLSGVDVTDTAGRFALSGLRGNVAWHGQDEGEASRIAFDGGRFYRIAFGAGALAGRLSGRRFLMQTPLEVSLLGGALEVEDLQIDAIGRRDLAWQFRGQVQPLSLARLSKALGWPTFAGTLAGDIPLVRYADGVIDVDGGLDMRVFDGHVRIDNLTVREAFGVLPELRADVDLAGLSLDALTGTFSFGNIQGRLEGRIQGLTLKDWKPTAFDARFTTPENDDSRHRISQRAVSNLASIGGAGEVLSSTFLRIFDEFSYRRLGISCRLENGVCEMDGVAPAVRGYYIVEGGGLPPRIDVLGFNRHVDWDVLLERLRQIVASEGPVIR